jgi:hypothetical protein
MEKLKNIEFNDWSKKALSNPMMKGHTIEYIFPTKFQKYCKLFHPFALSPDLDNMKGEEWNMGGKRAIEYLEGRDFEHSNAIDTYIPKPQSLLAKLFDQKFNKRFSRDLVSSKWGNSQPKWLLCPDEGTLDSSILPELTKLLSKYSESQNCFFHYVVYAIDTYEETIFKGLVNELPKTVDIGLAGTPNTVRPDSKEWYLYTNYDADYSLIGGTNELINEILSSEIIEALEWNESDIFYPEK